MPVRARPEFCCPPKRPRPLPAAKKSDLVATLKALADPTRLELLRLLAAQPGPVCVCDLVAHFELSQPTISHHLKVLKDADLVTPSRSGIWSFYAPNPKAIARLGELPTLLAFP